MLKPLVRWLCRRYASRSANQGDLHTAVKMWSMAIACGDTSPRTQRALGELYFRLGDYPRAIPLLESAAPHFTADGSFLTAMARAHQQAGNWDKAEACWSRAGELDSSAAPLLQLALIRHRKGDFAGAAEIYRQVLASHPAEPQTHLNLGKTLMASGRLEEAKACFESALRLSPTDPHTLCCIGEIYAAMADIDNAINFFEQAIREAPDFVPAYVDMGILLQNAKRLPEAAKWLQEAVRRQADNADAWKRLGMVSMHMGQLNDSVLCFKKALGLAPNDPEILLSLGAVLHDLMRHDEAIACYQKALTFKPDFAEAHNNLGAALNDAGRHAEAIASCSKALALKPDFAVFHFNLGNALDDLKRHEEAIASYRSALALKPDFAGAYNNLGSALNDLKRHDEAIASYQQALAIQPDLAEAHSSWVYVCQHLCAWPQVMPEIEALRERITQGRSGKMSPFGFLALPEMEAREHYLCARQFAQEQYRGFLSRPPLCGTELRANRDRLRIGYLSADYHDHPVSYLLAEVIERHDRNRFEVFGYSCGPDDASPMRRRMQAAFDTFREIRPLSHEAAAQQILDDGIDILVDLAGYTVNNRLPILALRPAPVQVNWLGYPGTLGHPRLADYLIGDLIVSPLEHADHYSETLALMPHCFQPNDRQRAIGARPTRVAAGLPADGFVFCCFNQSYKITPAMFDLWCRLLAQVPGSVLWLLGESVAVQRNLRREAQQRGVIPQRLIFAPRVNYAEHLARYQLTDLFLDTRPFNAGATASDALWAGVPLVTCSGETFAGRMAGSLLNATGLPELTTHSLQEYEALALKLATDSTLLAGTKARLARNRDTCPLFDSERFTRDLERLFRQMWSDYRGGIRQHIVIGADEEGRPL